MLKIAILDDYANMALSFGDWSFVKATTEVIAFHEHLEGQAAIAALCDFNVICTLRERTYLSREILGCLPKLKAVIAAAPNDFTIDREAAAAFGIEVLEAQAPRHLSFAIDSTTEFIWGLIIATVRQIPQHAAQLRRGHWQHHAGMSLAGKTLGVVGLGRFGTRIARIAQMFNLSVIAWSENLGDDAAAAAGAERVSKEQLFRRSDIVSIHYALSDRSRGLVGSAELGLMKPTAYIINTSRGPIIDETALVAALQERRIAGAGLDVFDNEPLPENHPFLKFDNVVATPHIGFVTESALEYFYTSIAETVTKYMKREDNFDNSLMTKPDI